jgi:type IV pilus assembly protein PilN
MRLDINLATRPYEDAREFWARWGLGVGLLAALTLFLLGLTVNDWGKAGRDRREIAQLQQKIAERDHERAQAQAYLDLAANRSTRDQSQFLNGLIQRKSFSWTRVFEDLEQVMPPNLHVVSLRPELNEQSQMELQMKVACDSRAAAVELVHRMEGSKHFQGAQLVDASEASQAGGVAASVVAIYVPDLVSDAKDKNERDKSQKDRSGK